MPQLQEILEILENAASKRFWGQIQFDFQDGAATLVRISETRKFDMEKNRQNETHQTARQ